jgi:hypothetical protein
VVWKQADKRLVRSGGGSCYARRTGRYGAWHQVGFMGARDAVHSVIDRDVNNREAARSNRWRCPVDANCIQCCVVPVGDNIGAGGNSDARAKINDANKRYEKRTSDTLRITPLLR